MDSRIGLVVKAGLLGQLQTWNTHYSIDVVLRPGAQSLVNDRQRRWIAQLD